MTPVNNETLLDYLLSELETDEVRSIDKELLRSPSLRKDLAEIQKVLGKVSLLNEDLEPPAGMSQRTLDRVFSAAGISADNLPEVPDRVIAFPLMECFSDAVKEPLDLAEEKEYAHRLVRRNLSSKIISQKKKEKVPDVIPPMHENRKSSSASSALFQAVFYKQRNYTELSISVAVGILIALFVFPLIRFTGSQIQTYVTQSKINKINKNINVYSQLAESNILNFNALQANTAPQTAEAASAVRTDLTNSNWQEVVPARVPLLTVGSNSHIGVLPSDNERVLSNTLSPNSSPSSAYFMSSPVFADAGTNNLSNSTLAPQNPPDILYLGQMPEKIEQVELNHRDLDYQTLMSKINGTVSLMNGQEQSSPTVQTITGQNVLLQNGKVFFRELPVFLQQNR